MTDDEFDGLWVIHVGRQTLTYDGATVEITMDDKGVHYVVNGARLDSRYLTDRDTPAPIVAALKRRVRAQLENGSWPPV